MSNSWFPKMPPVMPISIAPAPQERPPVAMTLVLVGFAVAFGVWWWL